MDRFFLIKNRFFFSVIRFGVYSLWVPPGHSIGHNLKTYPLYDRFLPVLASHLSIGTIVDVGANIGDTALAMACRTKRPILAIEGSSFYFDILKKNVCTNNLEDQIVPVFALIGENGMHKKLQRHAGSASLIDSEEATPMVSLDSLLKEKTVLIKTDTDGFDHAVLRSGLVTISRDTPVLFWENEIRSFSDMGHYETLYADLYALGYRYFYVFDNFGQFLCAVDHPSFLEKLNAYMYYQQSHGLPRTFYYVDVMATVERDKPIAEAALREYQAL